MAKSKEPKWRRFHHSLSSNSCESVTIMEGDVSSDNGAILESMGRVSWLTSLDTVMHAGLPKMLASSGYKSQRRSRTKKKGGRERRGYKNKRDTA
jgi:predicted DCC family thiol-disulfide oxidoreductase YuxK